MADAGVTLKAGNVASAVDSEDGRCQLRMTVLAGALGYPFVVAPDLDNVGKFARGERKGVKESVRCFDGVFPDEIMRRVAIVSSRYGVMAACQPGRIIILHHMTVRTAFRIVAQVGIPLGVHKRVQA